MSRLDGKVALVTGGGRGIGKAVARALGEQGARIVLADNGCMRDGQGVTPSVVEEARAELAAAGLDVTGFAIDMTQEQAVRQLFEKVVADSGGIDILINSAGILRDRSLLTLTHEDFMAVVSAHLSSTFHATKAFAELARTRKRGGSIVNMVSLSGLLGNVGQLAESAAKGGIYAMTRTSSIELQKYGITVNAIAPIAKTRLTEDLPMFEKVEGTMEPEHIAAPVLYLVSELADGLSGVVLSVAGGRISRLSLTESEGRTKRTDGGYWTAEEIAENFEGISRF